MRVAIAVLVLAMTSCVEAYDRCAAARPCSTALDGAMPGNTDRAYSIAVPATWDGHAPLGGRRGVADDVDVGVRVFTVGVAAQVGWRLARRVDVGGRARDRPHPRQRRDPGGAVRVRAASSRPSCASASDGGWRRSGAPSCHTSCRSPAAPSTWAAGSASIGSARRAVSGNCRTTTTVEAVSGLGCHWRI